jgi:hypothetical protein
MDPGMFSNTFRLTIHIVALVSIAIGKHLKTSALFVVTLPVAFINSIVVIDYDT